MSGIFEVILAFMEKGGNVLWLIAALVFFMWTLIFERLWYFMATWKVDRDSIVNGWETRAERRSWNAKQIRVKLLSTSRELINDNMNVISTCVALCPAIRAVGNGDWHDRGIQCDGGYRGWRRQVHGGRCRKIDHSHDGRHGCSVVWSFC